MIRQLRFSVAAAAWCLLLVGTAQAQQDQVIGSSGVPSTGQITAMSPAEVTITVSGTARKFATNEIKMVTYGDEPRELENARNRVLQDQLEEALAELERIDATGIRRDAVKQDLEYYIAFCKSKLALTGGGNKAEAAGLMLNFVRNNAGSYHFFEAAEILGDLALSMQSYDSAEKYYSALGRAPWGDYVLRSNVLVAKAQVAQGKFAEASATYTKVIADPITSPEAARQKLLAQVGKAVCMTNTGDAAGAIKGLETIIAQNDPADTALFAHAYNALGGAYLKQNMPKDALLAYLHVDLLFYGDTEAHAEALYHMSKLWSSPEINQSSRAVNARNVLKGRYAGSVWAAKN